MLEHMSSICKALSLTSGTAWDPKALVAPENYQLVPVSKNQNRYYYLD